MNVADCKVFGFRHIVRTCVDFEAQAVLDVQEITFRGDVCRVEIIGVVRCIVIGVDGHVVGTIHIEGRIVESAFSRIVIDYKHHIVRTVISEGSGQFDGGPFVLVEGNIAAIHKVGSGHIYPVGLTSETAFGGVRQVDVEVSSQIGTRTE